MVVVAYNIPRELPRTLRSLSVGYQQQVGAGDYEVIVVDNGSTPPIDAAVFDGLSGNFRLLRVDDPTPSPVPAVNRGLRAASGETIGVMLDGARLASPGLVRFAIAGSRVQPRSGILTLGWYLGYDFQRFALETGWTQADEDQLLDSIGWPSDGYRLFEVSTMDESSVGGWFLPVVESNALFLPRQAWEELGGYDEQFTSPGAGLANYDALRRARELDLGWVVLLGEATFHQLHGGVATNVSPEQIDRSMLEWTREYERIRGQPLEVKTLQDPVFLGTLPEVLQPRFSYALTTMLHHEALLEAPVPPPVGRLEPGPAGLSEQWMELAAAASQQGLDLEALTFARWARAAHRESPSGPLLSYLASTKAFEELPPARQAQFHVDVGVVRERNGELQEAAAQYQEALSIEPGHTEAYLGLTRVKMPGPFYYDVLRCVHEEFRPATYLEIGIAEGVSLSLAQPPTIAVAVDPAPNIRYPLSVECHLYLETSNEFFAERNVRQLLGGRGPSIAFIDGLHQYPAVLEDFLHVEAISDPDTIVVLHDMIPFDEITQRAERAYNFYTGDVWKLLHCLADARPDLSWFTVRTPPSGLTFVTGLDAANTTLADRYDELVQKFGSLPFDEHRRPPGPIVDNDWAQVSERLRAARAAADGVTADGLEPRAAFTIDQRPAPAPRPRWSDAGGVEGAIGADLPGLEHPAGRGELQWRVEQLRATKKALDVACAELTALRETKLFRWSQPVRRLYGSLRHRQNGA